MLDKDIHLVDNNYTQTEKRNYIMAIDAGLLSALDDAFEEVKANPQTGVGEWPDGKYNGVFVEVGLTESAKKKTPAITFNFQGEVEGETKNKKENMWLSPKARTRSLNQARKLLLGLGAPEELKLTDMIAWANENAVEHAVEISVNTVKGYDSPFYNYTPVDEIELEDEEDDLFGGSDLTDEEDEDNIFGE